MAIRHKKPWYDASSRRWRNPDGKIVKKSTLFGSVKAAEAVTEAPSVPMSFRLATPLSDSIEDYYRIQREGVGLNKLLASTITEQTPKPMPVPTAIKSAMALAEYYTSTVGDVWQHIEAPIDIGMTDLDIDCPDTAVKKELFELYSPNNYDMWETLYQSWLCCSTYGSAYPLEVPDVNRIVLLPPRYVWVGYYVNYGVAPHLSVDNPSPYGLNPPEGVEAWTEELVETTVMPMSYNTFGAYINEQILKTWGLPLDPELLHPIRAKALPWQRYPLPPISRAFNSISSRFVLQEAIRATIEGIKNQLWVFHLGDKDYRPTPKEVKAFTSLVVGAGGDRTGAFVWTDPFKVEQYTPANTDSILANETYQIFTLNVFRDLGSNMRLTTGNGLMVGRSDGTSMQVDMSVWLKRLEWPRLNVLRWEHEFRKRLAARQNSPAWVKANEKTTVRFSKSLLEVGELIKNDLMPLYQIGSLSRQTLLSRAGYNYAQELANKKAEKPDDELFQPKSTFAQTTVNPETPESKTESTSTGRPKDTGQKPKVEAAVPTWDETKKGLMKLKSTPSSENS